MTKPTIRLSPLKLLLAGYAGYILVGWVLLSLPICQQGEPVPAIDNLFTATSAVSTTGLATVGTADSYSFWGELTILGMIQLGGIGYMTLGSFIVLARRKELPAERENIARLAFVLPEGFRVRGFLRNVIVFTAVIESIGALALFVAFRNAGVENPLWQAIFHSISAFCTAGFSLFPDSLEQFAGNFWVIAIISCLSLSGAIGFLVLSDFFWSISGLKPRRTLTTKIILHATFWTLLISWVGLFLMEPTYQELSADRRIMASGFQAMTALTTVGFNTTPIGSMAMAPTFLMLLLMVLGASPSGTGGGLKSTSVSAAFATVWSTLHSRSKVTFWGCEVPEHRLQAAFAAVVFYISLFFLGGLFLLMVQPEPFQDVIFEAASALGTVGISRGITGDLTPLGKCIVLALMFIGRVGPITFGLALFSGDRDSEKKSDDLAI